MANDNISGILGKLDELRAVFIIGQRAVPFIEEILQFFKEMSPLLDEINLSIRDSTKQIPRATSQIQSVSQATEMATTEILDLIDSVLLQVSRVKSGREQVFANLDMMAQTDARLTRLLQAELGGAHAALLAKVEVLQEEKQAMRENVVVKLQGEQASLDAIRDGVNRIMMALQVQDITTQQLAAVKHLFENIRDRLTKLVRRLSTVDIDEAVEDMLHAPAGRVVAFDPNARYDRSESRQKEADAVVAGFAGGAAPSAEPAAQSDIDALFGGDGGGAAPVSADEIDHLFAAPPKAAAPAAQSDIDALFAPPPAPAAQSDIDALFAAPSAAPAAPTSQDEIDKLFGGF